MSPRNQSTIQAVVSAELKDEFQQVADAKGMPASVLARSYISKGLADYRASRLTPQSLVDQDLSPSIEKATQLLALLRAHAN
jgi:hypothetical protein